MTKTLKWQMLAALLALGLLIYFLGPVITPFAISALIAYLGDPLVDRLEDKGVPRTVGVLILFLIALLILGAALLLLVPMLEQQISHLIEQWPRYLEWAKTHAFPWIERHTGLDLDGLKLGEISESLPESMQSGGMAAAALKVISKSGMAVVGLAINLLTIPVVSFYLLRDWDILNAGIRRLLPSSIEPEVVQVAQEADVVLGAFLRGQLMVMFALGTIYSIGLAVIGIDFALLIGVLAGLISVVPYLGTLIGVVAGVVAALFQYGDWLHVLLVLGVFSGGQMLEGMVLTPLIVGNRIGLHPVAVIFAVLAGGQLFGFLGVLLALPVAAVTMAVVRHFYPDEFAAPIDDAEPVPPAISEPPPTEA